MGTSTGKTSRSPSPQLTNDDVVEWQYRFYERLGCLAEDRRPVQAQIDLATADANEWLQTELTGRGREAKQKILYLEDVCDD